MVYEIDMIDELAGDIVDPIIDDDAKVKIARIIKTLQQLTKPSIQLQEYNTPHPTHPNFPNGTSIAPFNPCDIFPDDEYFLDNSGKIIAKWSGYHWMYNTSKGMQNYSCINDLDANVNVSLMEGIVLTKHEPPLFDLDDQAPFNLKAWNLQEDIKNSTEYFRDKDNRIVAYWNCNNISPGWVYNCNGYTGEDSLVYYRKATKIKSQKGNVYIKIYEKQFCLY